MIYIYTITEKPLAEKSITITLPDNAGSTQQHLVVVQSYISWLGPWFPASFKTVKVYDNNNVQVPKKKWTAAVKQEATALKATVPFQIGFFRNTIILAVVLGILSLVMPRINKQRAAQAQANITALNEKMKHLAPGDMLRVSFIKMINENTAGGEIGLAKVTRISNDTLFIVRSTNMAENTIDNKKAPFTATGFSAIAEKINLQTLIISDADRILQTYPAPGESSGNTIGTVIGLEN
ncbi:hypothetical protein [Chitinophaga nivalis]|uniref:Uncharacterized protein n=1 Tax=Chitinophaga nivalis TaxID=2991709 RepID=A0ABT3IP98_9BACT|nr:hypothetical protein [Chitinophaga nivalis]MCW3464512.1 hypothetical protein [Chitinophaga nivalis]MCW3485797.1 hypothetical protein [Chitinophaga nivalis]